MSQQITLFISDFGGVDCRSVKPAVYTEFYEPAEWTTTPVSVKIPQGWALAESSMGSIELYDQAGEHQTLIFADGGILAVSCKGMVALPTVSQ